MNENNENVEQINCNITTAMQRSRKVMPISEIPTQKKDMNEDN